MEVGWRGGWQNAPNDAPAIEDRGPQLYSHAQKYIAAHICSHTDFVHKHIYRAHRHSSKYQQRHGRVAASAKIKRFTIEVKRGENNRLSPLKGVKF